MEVTFAIDYGTARIGTAISIGWLARPFEVLPHHSLTSLIERLLTLAKQEMATQFLVGLPVNADGSEGAQAIVVRAFAQELANRSQLPVLLWDEYGSSQAALANMINANLRRKKRRKQLDAYAAVMFLQEFIERSEIEPERLYAEEK